MKARSLPDSLDRVLGSEGELETRLQRALDTIADHFEARTATLHGAGEDGEVLQLLASRGIPEKLLPVTRSIPFGKGMAGICALRREPVTTCNLQTDDSGVVRPGARETGVAGAIVVPVFSGEGERLVGTLGIGKAAEHEYTDEERESLAACARILATVL